MKPTVGSITEDFLNLITNLIIRQHKTHEQTEKLLKLQQIINKTTHKLFLEISKELNHH